MITIGTTIQQDTEITFLKTELSGFTRYLNANPFAILDTKNQVAAHCKNICDREP